MINKEELQKVHVLEQNGNKEQVVQLVELHPERDDEISPLDLWLVIDKRRNILLAIILAFLAMGITFAIMKSASYNYSAVLEVGVMGGEGQVENKTIQFIEPPGNVLVKLQKSYIPLALSQFLGENPGIESPPIVTAKMEKKSDLILLSVKGRESDSDNYLGIIQNIISNIQKDHQPQVDMTRIRYELSLQREKIILSNLENPLILKLKQKKFEIDQLNSDIELQNLQDERLVKVEKQGLVNQKKAYENKLASLADEHKRLTSELVRLSDVDRLLDKRLADLSATVENELKNRRISVSSVKSGPEAMTVLLLDNQIQSNRNQLASIEERLDIQQPALREKINNQLKANIRSRDYHQKLVLDIGNKIQKQDIDNDHAQQKIAATGSKIRLNKEKMVLDHENKILFQQQKIDGIAYKLKGIRDTEALTPPMKSLKPVGKGKALIVIVSLIAGVFIGLFTVFALEFLSKVKERKQAA